MCGRCTLRVNSRDLTEVFATLNDIDWTPRYNIAPTQTVVAIRPQEKGKGLPMDECKQRLLDSIERAFHGVELGAGASLHEAKTIDDYGTTAQRLPARDRDEKHDWRKLIDDSELVKACRLGALSFFDAAGLKFHLPACQPQSARKTPPAGAGGVA
jgi:putative SOS response-associated peptidase YedK